MRIECINTKETLPKEALFEPGDVGYSLPPTTRLGEVQVGGRRELWADLYNTGLVFIGILEDGDPFYRHYAHGCSCTRDDVVQCPSCQDDEEAWDT